jgi:3-oxoacyl-[acyl-carrier protein] reductase
MTRRVLFLTGGSRGIGAGLVVAAARAGFDVAFTYRSQKDAADAVIARAAAEAPEATVRAWALDVRDGAAVEAVGDAVLDAFDRVDVVVANAAITKVGLAFSTSDEDWNEVIDTNLTGAFRVTRQFLPAMLAQRWGRFIYISSVAANGMSGDPAYCASKAGLVGLSKAIAKEYGRKGITSNTVSLGLFETEMSDAGLSASNRTFYQTWSPAGRPGRLDEVASTVLHLASDASAFINGQVIGLDGGLDWYP